MEKINKPRELKLKYDCNDHIPLSKNKHMLLNYSAYKKFMLDYNE